jgi:hypothetical protein
VHIDTSLDLRKPQHQQSTQCHLTHTYTQKTKNKKKTDNALPLAVHVPPCVCEPRDASLALAEQAEHVQRRPAHGEVPAGARQLRNRRHNLAAEQFGARSRGANVPERPQRRFHLQRLGGRRGVGRKRAKHSAGKRRHNTGSIQHGGAVAAGGQRAEKVDWERHAARPAEPVGVARPC